MMDTLQQQLVRKWKIPSISDLEICGQFPMIRLYPTPSNSNYTVVATVVKKSKNPPQAEKRG